MQNGPSRTRTMAEESTAPAQSPAGAKTRSALSLRITPQPVRRQVEEQLRRAIMDGTYGPGEQLSDRVLCEELGVSHQAAMKRYKVPA